MGSLLRLVMSLSKYFFGALLSLCGCLLAESLFASEWVADNFPVQSRVLPSHIDPIVPPVVGAFDVNVVGECSGIIRSKRLPGVYWTHNDSHDIRFAPQNASRRDAWDHDPERARVFPIMRNGTAVTLSGSDLFEGVLVQGAINDDWEDLAIDERGRIVMGDFGNNRSERQDLMLYIFPEPDPRVEVLVVVEEAIPIHFPDQLAFPPPNKNFDAEALFCAFGDIYILTKHRSDTHTKLYRLDSRSQEQSNALTLLGRFDVGGQVTGADVADDGNSLAILTYESVWLFELKEGDDYFGGNAYWLPFSIPEAEGICFDDPETLLIASEQGMIYEIKRSALLLLDSGTVEPQSRFPKKLAMTAEALLNGVVPTDTNSNIDI